MTIARFSVHGALDSAGGDQKGTVEIDRQTGIMRVRPHGRQKTYDLSLDAVATLVCRSVVMAELRAAHTAKKIAKKAKNQ